ncbi:MAG: TolC family protein [Parafilimonas sp.]|nr:TolC family protein [Parafilimonas sp.]
MKNFNATKQSLLLALIFVAASGLHAQTSRLATTASIVQQNQILADTTPKKTVSNQSTAQSLISSTTDEDTILENRLVQLALAQPNYEQTMHQQKIFEYQLKKQRSAWLNLLTLSTTYNDQSFSKPANSGTTAYVYPKYFIGVNIPLGLIALNGTDVKITKESELIAKSQQQELAKQIKASVLINYKEYKANEKLLAIQNQVVDDEQANFLQVEQKFKDGTATLDAYNEASKKYNDEQVKVINLQLQQDLIRVELERLIGRKLEDAFK